MATEKNCTPDLPEARREVKPKGGRPVKAEEEKKELADALKDCSGMSNNLNQLTMKFNAAFKDPSDRRIQKLIQLTPQLEYQSQMIGQILIHIASLCSQR